MWRKSVERNFMLVYQNANTTCLWALYGESGVFGGLHFKKKVNFFIYAHLFIWKAISEKLLLLQRKRKDFFKKLIKNNIIDQVEQKWKAFRLRYILWSKHRAETFPKFVSAWWTLSSAFLYFMPSTSSTQRDTSSSSSFQILLQSWHLLKKGHCWASLLWLLQHTRTNTRKDN